MKPLDLLLSRLSEHVIREPGTYDAAVGIIDYTLRKYGTEPRTEEFWDEMTSGEGDKQLADMPLYWGTFKWIMGGLNG